MPRKPATLLLPVLLGIALGCSNSAGPLPESMTLAPSEVVNEARPAPGVATSPGPMAAAVPSSAPESVGDVPRAPGEAPAALGSARPVASAADSGAGASAMVVEAGPGSTDSAGGAGGTVAAGGAGGAGATSLGPVTIWLAGDSTVQNYVAGNVQGANGTELEGWGQELAPFFTPQVTVNNRAIGGRSVAFFMSAVVRDAAGAYQCVDDQGNPLYQLDAAGNRVDTSQWSQIKNGIQAGDFLLIQFGTNDETHDCPRFVNLEDFQIYLGVMVDTVRAKGATAIFVTPMSHRSFVGTTINNTLLPYANAMKAEAARIGVEVVDLNLRSVEYFNAVGNEFLATNIFDTGTTHFIAAGAIKMAELITGEIRNNGGPLAPYLE